MSARRTTISEYYRWLGLIAALIGICGYLALSWQYAHHLTTSNYDESAYLYKGFLFASQAYQPYADFAPWTNHMPLAYLVPGYLQLWFGPGMQTARIFAVVLGALSLIGLGLTGYRLGGVWWGAALIWIVTLNTGWVKAFSQVFSQGLICFLFSWMLYFVSGSQRKIWELSIAAFLAGLAGMTRINLLPVLFLYLLYLLWSSGWKTAGWAALFGILPIAALHLVYWPDILKFWAYWLPVNSLPWISQYQSPWHYLHLPEDFSWWPVSDWWGDRSHLAWTGLKVFWQSIRANFVPGIGVLLSIIFWPRKRRWAGDRHAQLSVFLLVVYLSMFLLHTWAAIGGKTCQFSCFVGYLMFFNWFGLILTVLVGISWQAQPESTRLLTARRLFFLVFGASVLLSPAPYFVSGLNALTCGHDVVASHEGVGIQLQKGIPAGSKVFWDVKSDMLLLYLPDIELFLPQISYRFSFVDDPGADWEELQRFGWWNYQLGEEWISQADYIVVEQRFYDGLWSWNQRVARGEFEKVFVSMDPESCRPGISNVIILKPVISPD